MVSVLAYLGSRFFYRLFDFLRHWYKNGLFFFFRRIINLLEKLDRYFALKVTFRHFLKPLYQNHTFIGYLLGFIFRGIRLVVASLVYFLIILTGLALYLAWASIPVFVLSKLII